VEQSGSAIPTLQTIFVAGASGRTGQRVVRELLQSGAKVKAGIRESSNAKAKEIFFNAEFMDQGLTDSLELYPIDLENQSQISEALKDCDAVVSALGALETEALDWTAPYRVDGTLTQNLIKASMEQKEAVKHFIMVSSLGTGKIGFPASVLNLFWGVLTWKRQSEKLLESSGIPYTIVRPGGMERPKDDFELTHNIKLQAADTTFGGNVSRLQVAKLVSAILQQPDTTANKIIEVVAETQAPKKEFSVLLEEVCNAPTDEEWRARLNLAQYQVLRKAATEPPYTSPLNYEKRSGDFVCSGCGHPLFRSEAKFDSGTGWPSFFQPINNEDSVALKVDYSLGMPRMEVLCGACEGHLGHVFRDGPRPTGLRYCMNGVAMQFSPDETKVKETAEASSEKQEAENLVE